MKVRQDLIVPVDSPPNARQEFSFRGSLAEGALKLSASRKYLVSFAQRGAFTWCAGAAIYRRAFASGRQCVSELSRFIHIGAFPNPYNSGRTQSVIERCRSSQAMAVRPYLKVNLAASDLQRTLRLQPRDRHLSCVRIETIA